MSKAPCVALLICLASCWHEQDPAMVPRSIVPAFCVTVQGHKLISECNQVVTGSQNDHPTSCHPPLAGALQCLSMTIKSTGYSTVMLPWWWISSSNARLGICKTFWISRTYSLLRMIPFAAYLWCLGVDDLMFLLWSLNASLQIPGLRRVFPTDQANQKMSSVIIFLCLVSAAWMPPWIPHLCVSALPDTQGMGHTAQVCQTWPRFKACKHL